MADLPTLQPVRPFGNLALGVEAGQSIGNKMQEAEMRQAALDQYRGRQSALQSGNREELMKYDPELVMKMDEGTAKRAAGGIEMLEKMAPFLVQQAGDPRVWAAAAQDLQKFGAPDSVVKSLTTGTPQERLTRLKGYVDYASNMKVSLTERLAKIEADKQKDVRGFEAEKQKDVARYKAEMIDKPLMQFESSLKMQLADKTEGLKEKYEKVKDNRVIEREMMKDFTSLQTHLIGERTKQEKEINEQFSMMRPDAANGITQEDIDTARDRAVRGFREGQGEDYNRLLDMFQPFADKYGVKLPPRMATPASKGDKDKAGGYPVLNKRTGKTEYLTKEQYDQVKKAQSAAP